MTNDREQALVRAGLGALGCAAFVAVAVGAEVVGVLYADSPVRPWTEGIFPVAWPQPIRVAWWLAVGAAAFGYRRILHRIGIRQPAWVITVSVVPFVILAGGVATRADWATWH